MFLQEGIHFRIKGVNTSLGFSASEINSMKPSTPKGMLYKVNNYVFSCLGNEPVF